jgi:hypothetical protein
MGRIVLDEAAKNLPYTLTEIENAITEYDLAAERNTDGKVVSVEQEPLGRILTASGLRTEQADWRQQIADVAGAVRRSTSDKWSAGFTALAALGAVGAAFLALLTMFNDGAVLSARTSYEVRSAISTRLLDVVLALDKKQRAEEAAAAAIDEQVRVTHQREAVVQTGVSDIYAADLDTRVKFLDELHTAGIVVGEEWTSALEEICIPLNRANYFGRSVDIFISTKKMCDAALARNEWAPR